MLQSVEGNARHISARPTRRLLLGVTLVASVLEPQGRFGVEDLRDFLSEFYPDVVSTG